MSKYSQVQRKLLNTASFCMHLFGDEIQATDTAMKLFWLNYCLHPEQQAKSATYLRGLKEKNITCIKSKLIFFTLQ